VKLILNTFRNFLAFLKNKGIYSNPQILVVKYLFVRFSSKENNIFLFNYAAKTTRKYSI